LNTTKLTTLSYLDLRHESSITLNFYRKDKDLISQNFVGPVDVTGVIHIAAGVCSNIPNGGDFKLEGRANWLGGYADQIAGIATHQLNTTNNTVTIFNALVRNQPSPSSKKSFYTLSNGMGVAVPFCLNYSVITHSYVGTNFPFYD
jgi:hypothetical protein